MLLTADFLAFHAVHRPDHPLLVEQGRETTYREFWEDLLRVIPAISTVSIPEQGFVAVEMDGLYRHWLLLQAFECLGIATFSYSRRGYSPVYDSLLRRAAVIVHAGPVPVAGGERLCTDDEWWEQALSRTPMDQLPVPPPPDRWLRIACSSGTTAAAKSMAITALQSDFRLTMMQSNIGLSPASRQLLVSGFTLQAAYVRAMTCLRAGATVLFDNRILLWDQMLELRPTHVSLMPGRLLELLEHADAEIQPAPVHITSFGGKVPQRVRERLLRKIASAVFELYGSNEFSAIASIGPDGRGAVFPGVEVEIVDDRDGVLPFGTSGLIRVKSPGCVSGYQFEAKGKAGRFLDGWCYPGDIGMLEAPGILHLQGRGDDILNIRGIKIFAPEFEDRFQQIPEITDVAVTTVPDRQDMTTLCVVLVMQQGADIDTIRSEILARLPDTMGRFFIVPVNRIPRTESGKIQRPTLQDWVRRTIAAET